jgi:hypothetical protein
MQKPIYCFDLDGVVAEDILGSVIPVASIESWTHQQWKDYFYDCKPCQLVIDTINLLYDQGCTIKLYTARNSWATEVTVEWLLKHGVKYHDIKFDKPRAHVYIDDRGYYFHNVVQLRSDLNNLAESRGIVFKTQ